LLLGHTNSRPADKVFNQKELITKYIKDLNEKINYMYEKARENVQRNKAKAKERFDKHVKIHEFKENQLVWLKIHK